ncbi:MAG TPA: helicase-related protein, partial [Flavobacteriales bacterium]|nr:helicase-related protein [Flavobacteriales bacterium]
MHESERPAIVYASRTKRVEELRSILEASGLHARAYHGKMKREEKQANQDAFMKGDAEVMVATNAFGMGVDKEDVRTVIHYNISSSLESYVQEAGRAGRKKEIDARCCILYHESDLGGHFQLLNRSKLNQQEIDQVWRALKRLTKFRDKVSKSALEIAIAAGWDTEIKDLNNRVTASLAALEDRGYVQRTLNTPRVFATGLLEKDLEAAFKKVRATPTLTTKQQEDCARVLQRIIKSDETRVDALAEQLGMPLKQVL